MKRVIEVLKDELVKIEDLNNKKKKTKADLKEGIRIFGVFSSFIDDNSENFKKFKGDDKYMYEEINDWNERQSSVLSDIIHFGFKNTIGGSEGEASWVIYEAWLLGDLISRYYK